MYLQACQRLGSEAIDHASLNNAMDEALLQSQSNDRSIQRLMFHVKGRSAPRPSQRMATDTEERSDLENVMLDHKSKEHPLQHPPHPQSTQPETSIIEKCVLLSIPQRAAGMSELFSQHAAELPIPSMHNYNRQPSSETSAEPTDLAQIRNALELSLGRKLRFLPTKAKQMVIKYLTGGLLDSSNGTSRPNERVGEHNSDSITIHMQQKLFDGSEFHTNIQTESPCASNPALQPFPAPQNLFMMESMDSDQYSMRSYSSAVPNKYQRWLSAEDSDGRYFRVWVQFDTGAGSNFISRGTLELLGRIKSHSIPSKYQEEYCCPIDENKRIQPTHCVFVKMWDEELNFFVPRRDAKLKVIERPDVLQIIIGRHLIDLVTKRTGTSLLARLEEVNDDAPIAEADINLIGALIKNRRSEAQRAIDAAKNERHRQAFLERQKILASSLPPSSSGLARDNGTRSPETDKRETTNQQPDSRPRRLDYHQGSAQQTTPSSFAGFPEPRRTDTSSTQSSQYTQYTQYSMDRQSTTSTMSSLSDATLYTPKKGGRSAAPRTQEE